MKITSQTNAQNIDTINSFISFILSIEEKSKSLITFQFYPDKKEDKTKLGMAGHFSIDIDIEKNTYTLLAHNTISYYPKEQDFVQELINKNNNRSAIAWMVNEGNGLGREAVNIQRIRAYFIDADNIPLEDIYKNSSLEPHLITKTSANNYHVYWFVKNAPLDTYTQIQEQLAKRFGGDRD